MLRRTFIHVEGIGPEVEQALWRQGCTDWEAFLDSPDWFDVGPADRQRVAEQLRESLDRLEAGDHAYFARRLGLVHAWRAYPDFRDRCAYLDIETDGGRFGKSITLIGLYDGEEFHHWVRGEGLEGFRDAISHYSMVVTFFGSRFDLPLLEQRFRGLRFDQIHLDLCPTLRRIGLSGGLKRIERDLGIVRAEGVEGLGGRDAINLWKAYELEHDEEALRRLIAYNREDVVNLETLAVYAYGKLSKAVFG